MRRSAFIKLTENDMARVIIQALYNLPALPPADNVNVVRKARQKREVLVMEHKLAMKAIQSTQQEHTI